MPAPWIHFAASVPQPVQQGLLALLARAGLRPGAMPTDPAGDGLFVLDAPGAVMDQLRQASRRATVLAIVVAPRRPAATELWPLLQAGAADVLLWPELPADAQAVQARLARLATVQAVLDSPRVAEQLIGRSAVWRGLLRQVVELALFAHGPLLINGASGTGKELVARLVHDLDPRSPKGALVVVDCTTLTPELSGSELFGHERGAFTGALQAREGAFALAHGGTLFLDEIGELPLPLQAQLLRAVQEGQYKRVGGNAWQRTDFRLVSATHRDLEAGIADGSFRADLYYRIAGSVCRTPRLAERCEDVLPLALHFQAQHDSDDAGEGFDEPVRQYLAARDYPGNVRDLRRVVSWLCQHHAGPGPVTLGDVPAAERPQHAAPPGDALEQRFALAVHEALDRGLGLKEIGAVAAESAIRLAIERERGNLHRAAQRLGVTDRALQLRRAQQRPAPSDAPADA